MKKLMLTVLGLSLAGCCLFKDSKPADVAAVSPDGKNGIRLWTDPLAYEVVRGGQVVVAKSEIGMKVDGKCLNGGIPSAVTTEAKGGTVETPVYKKDRIDLSGNETFVDFGDWGVRLAARNDGVAYRFETKMPGKIKVNCEKATVNAPDAGARCCFYRTGVFGGEEFVPTVGRVGDISHEGPGRKMVYLPLTYTLSDDTTVAVTDADVRDYPVWYLKRADAAEGVRLESVFAGWPVKTHRHGNDEQVAVGGRWVRVDEYADYLVETEGTRTFPWRAFILGDAPKALCEADIVQALSAPRAKYDFSWVKPGKVAWDWWNAFDNQGEEKGCTTKTYERFIDFAAKTGVEYVIFDEGWSEKLNIWKFHKNVDVPHLIDYANKKGVGIILWMAWAQVVGDEERVASHFAKLGAKGFKVDFMDRGDAEVERFLWKFADACARNRMVIDYHGAHRPTGMSRAYPNVLNYEGIHGLEQMKWFGGDYDFMQNDVAAFFGRQTAGPMDYTPGAMVNYPVGKYPKKSAEFNPWVNPGSEGTRCHQMAMMVAYEAPLQMLSDSPTNYEKNMECFAFMAATPVVWADTVGLGGCPRKFAAVARKAKDGSWYAAAINSSEARDYTLYTSFLGEGMWNAEIFRDAEDADTNPTHYVHGLGQNTVIRAGGGMVFRLAKGGGVVVRFTKNAKFTK